MGFGEKLRQEAARAPDKRALGQSGAWSLVLSAPGFMGGMIVEWWLTAKWMRAAEPTAEDWVQLRTLIGDAGGQADADPEHPAVGTNLWRWAASETDDKTPATTPLDPLRVRHIDPDSPPDIITDKVGRNDPCPCGSGKKYKKCCLGNRQLNTVGTCIAPVGAERRCGKPGQTAFFCKLCGKQFPWCGDEQHKKDAQTMMNGHVVRIHPEVIPLKTFDNWIKDPVWMALHEEQRAKHPELWERLFEYIEQRKNAAGPS